MVLLFKKEYHVWIPSICHPALSIIYVIGFQLHSNTTRSPTQPNAPRQRPIPALHTSITPSYSFILITRFERQHTDMLFAWLGAVCRKTYTTARCCRLCNPASVSHRNRFTNITTDCRTVRDWSMIYCQVHMWNFDSRESLTFQAQY